MAGVNVMRKLIVSEIDKPFFVVMHDVDALLLGRRTALVKYVF